MENEHAFSANPLVPVAAEDLVIIDEDQDATVDPTDDSNDEFRHYGGYWDYYGGRHGYYGGHHGQLVARYRYQVSGVSLIFAGVWGKISGQTLQFSRHISSGRKKESECVDGEAKLQSKEESMKAGARRTASRRFKVRMSPWISLERLRKPNKSPDQVYHGCT
ncbi:MAG TPA: hypothetical protein VFO10_26630 [Oligoflexus sp.]|uniref:hypothetical protein n=1 Tax=Oligoflexus sp. TaxID=1971216 RepID=UPI002D80A779|nr:hypothetical protein [Oligoflexus sp.]HET9240869.1 hypothetical protein [Oligoflexus sp.]